MPTTQNNTKKRKLYKSKRYNKRKDKGGGGTKRKRTNHSDAEGVISFTSSLTPNPSKRTLSLKSKSKKTATANATVTENATVSEPAIAIKSKSKSKSKSPGSMRLQLTQKIIDAFNTRMKNKEEYEKKFSFVGMNVIMKYLKNICPNSGHCLAFGRENALIDKYFDFFNDFAYVDPASITTINSGENGFITAMDFVRDSYKVSTILKTAKKVDSDNIFYEAFVGLAYINEQNNYFPCFLKTYNLFQFNEPAYRTRLEHPERHRSDLAPDSLNAGLKKLGMNDADTINTSCSSPTQITLLLQFIENPIQLYKWLYEQLKNPAQCEYMFSVEIVCILFQVYSVLSAISDEFTHYDLHSGNVLLYQVPDSKYVTMKYHMPDGPTVVFKTRYIAKIIDYGRCYTKHTPELYTNVICKAPSCSSAQNIISNGRLYQIPCGESNGFNFFFKTQTEDNFFISSRVRNKSHDLRLATLVYQVFLENDVRNKYPKTRTLHTLMKEIYENYDPRDYYKGDKYGTPENIQYSVNDFALDLFMVMTQEFAGNNYFKRAQNNFYTSGFGSRMECAGTFEIWLARNNPMKFTPMV